MDPSSKNRQECWPERTPAGERWQGRVPLVSRRGFGYD
jgi:hypothetical protein